MDTNKREQAEWQQDVPYDGSGLSDYTQGLEYHQHFQLTQPVPLNSREDRFRQLRARRMTREQGKKKRFLRLQLWNQMGVGQAALLLTCVTFISRFLGLFRSSLFAAIINVGSYSDAYNLAFNLPSLIYNIVSGGALLSAFIPVFNLYMLRKRDEQSAWEIASSALNLAIVGLIVLSIAGIIFADPLIHLYYFNSPSSEIPIVVSLTRIMFLQSVFLGGSVIVTSILNARHHFLLPAIGSVLYPLGIIAGLTPGVILKILHQQNDILAITGASWGVVLGAALMLIVQIPGLARVGMNYRFLFRWRHPAILQIGRQMLPRVANSFMVNISTNIDVIFLSLLIAVAGTSGLVTQDTYAFTIVSIPLSVIIPVATAAFPRMAEYVVQGQIENFRKLVLESIRSVLFISLPISVGMAMLSLPLVQVLYEHYSFSLKDAQSTAIPLTCYALCVPGIALAEILARSFYALRQSRVPVYVSFGQILMKIVMSIILIDPAIWCVNIGLGKLTPTLLSQPLLAGAWGMGALAIATMIAESLEALTLLWLLHQRIHELQLRALFSFTLRVFLATIVMAVALMISHWLLDILLVTNSVDGDASLSLVTGLLIMLKLGISSVIGGFVYLRMARFLRVLENRNLGAVNRLLMRLRLSWI